MKKGIIITIGVLIAGGIGYYIFTKSKKPSPDRMQSGANDDIPMPTTTTTTSTKPTTTTSIFPSYSIGYIQVDKTLAKSSVPHLIALGISSNRPKANIIKVGDTISITGTGLVGGSGSVDGRKRVEKIWVDPNGNIGAIYVITSYRFPPVLISQLTESGYNYQYKNRLTSAKLKKTI